MISNRGATRRSGAVADGVDGVDLLGNISLVISEGRGGTEAPSSAPPRDAETEHPDRHPAARSPKGRRSPRPGPGRDVGTVALEQGWWQRRRVLGQHLLDHARVRGRLAQVVVVGDG